MLYFSIPTKEFLLLSKTGGINNHKVSIFFFIHKEWVLLQDQIILHSREFDAKNTYPFSFSLHRNIEDIAKSDKKK